MSVIHLNQIKNRIDGLFRGHISMSDIKHIGQNYDDHFSSRGLAAYTIQHMTDCTIEQASSAIVDGGDDNGIDAIYFDEANATLYLVQAKWIKDGKGEPDNAGVKKFAAGIEDLLSMNFDRFNAQINNRQNEIVRALTNAGVQVHAILVHTGNAQNLAIHSERDIKDLVSRVNDASEILSFTTLNQSLLHKSLTEDLTSPITEDIPLHYYGKVEDPREAFYGRVCALDLAKLWSAYKDRVVSKNLRGALGDTDVNLEIRDSLANRPSLFWYFNNGVTATAHKVSKTAAGGGSNVYGVFHCEGINIVNGAQTVSTIGKYLEKNPGADLSSCFVQFRIVSLQDGGTEFGDEVTRTNNRQNRIEARDFVSQDPEQKRIRDELLIDQIHYQIMRSDDLPRGGSVFDLQDSTTALVCASGDVVSVVTLKSQIGKLWEDIQKTPYKSIFNASISGLYVWRCIQTQRLIDTALDNLRVKFRKPRENRILTYGNRLISALVFMQTQRAKFNDPSFNFDESVKADVVNTLVENTAGAVVLYLQRFYQNSIIPTFFKNQTKCREVFDNVGRQLSSK